MATHTLDMEIFSVGTWNGEDFTPSDLEEIAANFEKLKEIIKPPLKFGHDDKQNLTAQEDGDPALGWVESLRVVGGKLLATVKEMPAVVYKAIKAGRYKRVSAEIYLNVKLEKKKLGKVLKAVALLGADIPAVNDLADLTAYLTAPSGSPGLALGTVKTVNFTVENGNIHNTGGLKMPEKEKTAPVVSADVDELAVLRQFKARAVEEGRLQEIELKEAAARRGQEAFGRQKAIAMEFCEKQVVAGVMTPALRTSLGNELEKQAAKFTEAQPLTLSMDTVIKMFEASDSPLKKGETAESRKENLDAAPIKEYTDAIHAHQTVAGCSYMDATQFINASKPDLQVAYAQELVDQRGAN